MEQVDQMPMDPNKESVDSEENFEIDEVDKVTNCKLICNPKFLFASSSGALGYFLYGFMEPILAFRMKDFKLD